MLLDSQLEHFYDLDQHETDQVQKMPLENIWFFDKKSKVQSCVHNNSW